MSCKTNELALPTLIACNILDALSTECSLPEKQGSKAHRLPGHQKSFFKAGKVFFRDSIQNANDLHASLRQQNLTGRPLLGGQ